MLKSYPTRDITFPKEMLAAERRRIAFKSRTFQLIEELLYKIGPHRVLRRCIIEEEISGVLRESHEGLAGGHMGLDATTRKVLLARLWWPTLYGDTCQRAGKPLKRDFMPLFPSQPQELFERWGMDFVGPLPVSSKHRCRYIVVATNYLTKSVEVRALRDNTAFSIARFLYEQIVTRFSIPLQLTSDRGVDFSN